MKISEKESTEKGGKKMKTNNLSFLSGLIAFALIFTLFTPMTTTYAETKDNSVRSDVYGDNVRDDVYGDSEQKPDESVRDDVYSDKETEETVTENVYKALYQGNVKDYLDNSGNIVLTDVRTLSVPFTDLLHDLDDDQVVSIVNEGITLTMPAIVLKDIVGNEALTVEIKDVTETHKGVDGLVSNVFDFSLFVGDMEAYTDNFSEPFIVTFTVNPSLVENWDDLVLRYFTEDGYIDSPILSYDKETGEVVVEIYHFSQYGIVEVEGGLAEEDEDAVEGGTGLVDEEDEETGSTTEDDESETVVTETTQTASGGELPQTATSMFNLLAIGLVLMTAGVALYMRNRKAAAA